MNKLKIEGITQDKVEIKVEDAPSGLKLIFKGDIDMVDPSIILDPLFDKVHNGMIGNKLTTVLLDFNELAFLNSSGIKAIAKWVMKLGALPADGKYVIQINHNKAITWQTTSLPTLTYLVPGAVKVE